MGIEPHIGSVAGATVYRFGRFVLDPRDERLTVDGEAIPLTPKVLTTLLLMVRSGGRLMTREELMDALWPDTVVTEANLSQNVFILRQALGDGKDGARFIETVPRRGYRFLAPVVTEPREKPESAERVLSPPSAADGAGLTQEKLPAVRDELVPPRRRIRLARSGAWIGAMSILALIGVWAGKRAAARRPVPGRASVAVFELRGLPGEARTRWLGTALAELIDSELAAGGALRLVPGESVSRFRRETGADDGAGLSSETLGKIRRVLGADYVVNGTYVEFAGEGERRLRVIVRLQETASGESLVSHAETGSDADLPAIASKAAAVLRERLSAGALREADRVALGRSAPVAMEARSAYFEGLQRLRALDAKGAAASLERAVAVEPAFAPAHAALAEAWALLGRDPEAAKAASKALDLSRGLPRDEVLFLEARAYEASRNWPKAVETYSALARFFPDVVDYGLSLAQAEVEAGSSREALATVAALRKLPAPASDDPRLDLAEAKAAESLGDFGRADAAGGRALAKGRALGSTTVTARAILWQAVAAARRGRTEEAGALFSEARKLFESVGDFLGAARAANGLGNVLADRGEPDRAQKEYEGALTTAEQFGHGKLAQSVANNLGILAKDRGDLQAALAIYDRLVERCRAEPNRAFEAMVLGNRGVVLRNLGRLSEARTTMEESIALHRTLGDEGSFVPQLTNLSDTTLRQGNLPLSLRLAEESLALARKRGDVASESAAAEQKAEILAWSGRLEESVALIEQSIATRRKAGLAGSVPDALSTQAFILRAAGKSQEAAVAALEAAREFEKERSRDREILARARLALALVDSGRLGEAGAEVERARRLAETSQDLWSRLHVSWAQAVLHAASGRKAAAGDAAEAMARNAEAAGIVPLELEGRLLLAGIEPVRDRPAAGAADPLREAERLGFRLLTVSRR